MGIKVYSVGFYADLSNPKLRELPKLAAQEEKIKFLVDNTSCLLRISTCMIDLPLNLYSQTVAKFLHAIPRIPTCETRSSAH